MLEHIFVGKEPESISMNHFDYIAVKSESTCFKVIKYVFNHALGNYLKFLGKA